MQRRTFLCRLVLGGVLAGNLLGSLVVQPLAEGSSKANQHRAVCRHGNKFWRGPIRVKYSDADKDRRQHAQRCPFTDNGVITPIDPIWQTP